MKDFQMQTVIDNLKSLKKAEQESRPTKNLRAIAKRTGVEGHLCLIGGGVQLSVFDCDPDLGPAWDIFQKSLKSDSDRAVAMRALGDLIFDYRGPLAVSVHTTPAKSTYEIELEVAKQKAQLKMRAATEPESTQVLVSQRITQETMRTANDIDESMYRSGARKLIKATRFTRKTCPHGLNPYRVKFADGSYCCCYAINAQAAVYAACEVHFPANASMQSRTLVYEIDEKFEAKIV